MSTRREFVSATGVAGAAVALGLPAAAQEAKPAVKLLLSSQEGIIPGKDLSEKVKRMEDWGFDGIELGANIGGRIEEIKKALGNSKIKVSAICAAGGPYIVPDEAAQRRVIDNAKKIMEAAGQIGSTGVIMVPAFNGAKDQLLGWAARELLIKQLKEMGEYGVQVKSRMLLEPLNRGEARFLRQLADAASICRDVDSPGVGLMGDFYHMRIEETSDQGAFLSAGKWLHHVHLASWSRVLPGQDQRSFVDGFKGLKAIGYPGFCSLECGCKGDRMVEIPKAVKFLREQWEQA